MQRALHEARLAGRVGDTLLAVEHSSVFTLGRSASFSHILWDKSTLGARGVEVVEADRGGDVAFHGPGQVVVYPIIGLVELGLGVAAYVDLLEEAMISVLRGYGLDGVRDGRGRGVWVGDAKIGFVGIRVSRRVTLHGIALNVRPDLSFFDGIVPCGLAGCAITSMERELGRRVDFGEVRDRLLDALSSALAASHPGCRPAANPWFPDAPR